MNIDGHLNTQQRPTRDGAIHGIFLCSTTHKPTPPYRCYTVQMLLHGIYTVMRTASCSPEKCKNGFRLCMTHQFYMKIRQRVTKEGGIVITQLCLDQKNFNFAYAYKKNRSLQLPA